MYDQLESLPGIPRSGLICSAMDVPLRILLRVASSSFPTLSSLNSSFPADLVWSDLPSSAKVLRIGRVLKSEIPLSVVAFFNFSAADGRNACCICDRISFLVSAGVRGSPGYFKHI